MPHNFSLPHGASYDHMCIRLRVHLQREIRTTQRSVTCLPPGIHCSLPQDLLLVVMVSPQLPKSSVTTENSLAWRMLEYFLTCVHDAPLLVMLADRVLSAVQIHRVDSNKYCYMLS